MARLRAAGLRVRRDAAASGPENMAADEALLEQAAREALPPTLRFYTWTPPAVSLGRFQQGDGIRLEFARDRGWDVVRRPTGGRAVLHQHELTYGLVLPPSVVGGVGVRTSYRVFSAALNGGLRRLLGTEPVAAPEGCEASRSTQPNCFALASECDSLVPGGKLVGSAQVRRRGALLQHGSILLDAEPEGWEALFGTRGRLVTLRQLLGARPAEADVAAAVEAGFRSLLG